MDNDILMAIAEELTGRGLVAYWSRLHGKAYVSSRNNVHEYSVSIGSNNELLVSNIIYWDPVEIDLCDPKLIEKIVRKVTFPYG